jgi:hypothetical protein
MNNDASDCSPTLHQWEKRQGLALRSDVAEVVVVDGFSS